MTEAVTQEMVAEHVALVTLNRPEVLNAVNGDLAIGLEAAVLRTEQDPNVWAVVLTGAGDRGFCPGADLKALGRGEGRSFRTRAGGFAGFVYQPRSKPWIAAINGAAVAGGLEIALTCELVVAAEHARLGLPEVKRALVAGAGGLFRLSRSVPRAVALEMILTGGEISADRALQYGLVNRVVPIERLIPEAVSLAQAICDNAPISVRESLKVARLSFDLDEAGLKEASKFASKANAATEDFREGPRAFVEKRAPRWLGR
ncbi:MAG: enoyl-CoA hydratase-related protein [Xanthobacteraceae bacterium]